MICHTSYKVIVLSKLVDVYWQHQAKLMLT